MTTKTFLYTGARDSWTVPIGVTSVRIEARGGNGGGNPPANQTGAGFQYWAGGHVIGTFNVAPGQLCYLRVGGNGQDMSTSRNQMLGGFNGGGNGTSGYGSNYGGASGGGASDVRINTDTLAGQLLVAAGAGGMSPSDDGTGGGSALRGHNATTAAGGAAGTGSWVNGAAGSRGQGAAASNPLAKAISGYPSLSPPMGGGGGAGYYGGGSGATEDSPSYLGGAGGHGSNYLAAGATGVTNTGATYVSDATPDTKIAVSIVLTYSLPPAAPTATDPFNEANVSSITDVDFGWSNPALPEAGDAISGYEIQYRTVGDTDWTSLGHVVSTAVSTTVPVTNFVTNKRIEWQVRSYGTLTANAGPWSASSYFTLIAPPDPPVISTPNAGDTISNSPGALAWGAISNQQAWEARRTADTAGAANTAIVYWDSAEILTPASSTTVPYDAATRAEHVQVRIMVQGLWSTWADVRVNVDIEPPPRPSIAAVPDSAAASIHVTVTNPAGGVALDHNEIWRSEDGITYGRVADDVAANGTWTDVTPAHGRLYYYQAVAVASDGAAISSDEAQVLVTWLDNGDGTLTILTGYEDNGDGTYSLTGTGWSTDGSGNIIL